MAKATWVLLSWVLVGVAAWRDATALRVTSGGVTPLPREAISETERLVQEWTVTADSGDQPLQLIGSGVACQLYVSYTPSTQAIATVRVIGDNPAIMENTVAVSVSSSALWLRPSATHAIPKIEGYARAEIVVHNAALVATIQSNGSGDIIVDEFVLQGSNPSRNITVKTSDSGDIYLPPQLRVNANAFNILVSGSGSIHGAAASVYVNDVDILVSGSGDVEFGAGSLEALGSLAVAHSGSGLVDLFFTRLHATEFIVKVSGSGDVTVATGATSTVGMDDLPYCALTTSGSGIIQVDSVMCTEAEVVTTGSGGISLSARQVLSCKQPGSGEISVHMIEPTIVKPSGCKVHTLADPPLPQAQPTWMRVYSLPPRAASKMVIVYGNGLSGRGDEDESGNSNDESESDQSSSTNYMLLWKPALVVVLAATVLTLWQRRDAAGRRQQHPDEKTPLVSEDDPVYI